NEASAFTFLDAIDPAETALRTAIDLFAAAADSVNQGRTRTNVGRLLVRTGRLAPALAEFEAAARDLLGSELAVETADADALRLADELLLEWALGYLALNLHPEAARLLDKAEHLFRQAGQPFELAQTLYTRAALARAQGEIDTARAAAAAALDLWEQLDNPYWRNRTRLILAQLDLATGDPAAALADVSAMLATPAGDADADAAAPTAWDTASRVQATLVQVDAHLALGDVAGAAASLAQTAAIGAPDALPPDLAVQVAYARGRVARAQGDETAARAAFQDAVARLERQRATLTLEQMRASYLLDKDALFSDLILSLLAQPAPSTATLGAVFDTIERLRSRVLLEQLLAVTDATAEDATAEGAAAEDETQDASATQGDDAALRDELRRRLNWLYNRLLGEEGSRHPFVELSQELQRTEAQLARLELRRAPSLPLAQPLPLADLQRRMPAAQVAVIYYVAADEVMALVVTADDAVLQRNLTRVAALQDAVDEFHFQLGRMEVPGGSEARLRRMAVEMRAVLGRLHTLLVAPFADRLDGRKVTWIPFGLLHQVPFHALWQGDGYLLERVTCTYAPSATLAARGWQDAVHGPLRTVAALAVDDPSIPAARLEAETVARAAPDAHLFVADEAGAAGLRRAAAADVLHIATHGLFRRDNPFFSALKLADGWIDVHELYRLPLAARLVILSACESGAARPTGGDELIGLARGFLAAGAHTLVVSRWNVHDATGAALMTRFHAHLRQEDAAARAGSTTDVAAAALRAAQVEAIHAGAHPYFWAPFQVIG
ncbi:MAG: CHAT domain-containing protein, partial [Caldilineaceae bacterium]|nr:CHAT domain-containing protein [Caldilineaceae bacterium]